MIFNRKSLVTLAVLAALGMQASPAQAGLGIWLATSQNDTTRVVGDVLIGVGLGVTILGATAGPSVTTQCTPNSPCQVYDGNYADNGYYNYPSDGYYYNGYAPYGDYCYSNGDCYSEQTSGTQTGNTGQIGVVLGGLVLLGTNAAPEVSFKPISADAAVTMKISANEAKAFNNELAQINLIANDFMSRLIVEAKAGKTDAQMKSDAAALWNTEAKPVLSADAFSAVQKSFGAYGALLAAEQAKK